MPLRTITRQEAETLRDSVRDRNQSDGFLGFCEELGAIAIRFNGQAILIPDSIIRQVRGDRWHENMEDPRDR